MPLPLFHVDAFTNRPFAGNPAAVCLLSHWPDDAWLQAVAGEMNLSETAFVSRRDDGYDLRWFTPKVEVDLCGHATLASAHVLWEQKWQEAGKPLSFHTRSGVLGAANRDGMIELDFPSTPCERSAAPDGLIELLGATPTYFGRGRFYDLVEFESEQRVTSLRPDFARLLEISDRGLIVTSRSNGKKYDFVSRFFAPGLGIDEDPVTGSAHCCLGVYWQERLGKDEFNAYQASARGGEVRVRVRGDRTLLGGHAITVVRGSLEA